jgi:hypothetical protein
MGLMRLNKYGVEGISHAETNGVGKLFTGAAERKTKVSYHYRYCNDTGTTTKTDAKGGSVR